MHLLLIIELVQRFLYQTSWQVNGCCAFVAARLLPRVCCYAFVATRLLLLSENVLMLENVKTLTLNEKLCRRCNFCEPVDGNENKDHSVPKSSLDTLKPEPYIQNFASPMHP